MYVECLCVCAHVCVDSPVCSSVLLDSCGSLSELLSPRKWSEMSWTKAVKRLV